MGEKKHACRFPGCKRTFDSTQSRAAHERLSTTHSVAEDPPADKITKGGDAVTQEQEDAVKRILAEEKKAEAQAKREESEKSGVAEAIKGIGDRLDKIDEGYCSKFPELCAKVDRMAEAMPKKVKEGSEEWKTETKAGLEHVLFDDCPNCTPLRDEVLSAKGKRLADVEAEAKVEEAKAKEEVKVEEVETKVDEGKSELRKSLGEFPGSKWDEELMLYVEQR